MSIKITQINHKNKKQAQDLMGGGKALAKEVLENLADELVKLPHAGSVIAYVDYKPDSLIECWEKPFDDIRVWFHGGVKAPSYGIYADFFDKNDIYIPNFN